MSIWDICSTGTIVCDKIDRTQRPASTLVSKSLPTLLSCCQIRTRAVSCKQMTMVHPLQLLMFSQSKVESQNGIIRVDDW